MARTGRPPVDRELLDTMIQFKIEKRKKEILQKKADKNNMDLSTLCRYVFSEFIENECKNI